MTEIFAKRRKDWYKQNLKYLRYVFNDHFVLFLMILLGALVVQYMTFLQTHQAHLLEKIILVVLVTVLSQLVGRIATFVEAADKVFLLPQELALKRYLLQCLVRSLILPAVLSLLLILIVAPLLNFSVVIFIIWFILLVALKGAWFYSQIWRWQQTGILNWTAMIESEETRKTATLRLFALFTNVKGLKSHSHRRKYLDFLLPDTRRTYDYLFMRSFLRSGDFLGLTLRLLVLSILSMIFISNGIVALIIVLVFNYLLIFQLLSLRTTFDYQLLTRIYPVKKTAKTAGLRVVLFRVMLVTTLIELIMSLIFIRPIVLAVVIVLFNFILTKFYVRFRLKK